MITRSFKQRGQSLLEYVLLIVIVLGIAAIIRRSLVNKDRNEPGALLKQWTEIIEQIGRDDPNQSTSK